jgi:hypothetical protein
MAGDKSMLKKILSFIAFIGAIALAVGVIVGGISLTIGGIYSEITWMIAVGAILDTIALASLGWAIWIIFSDMYEESCRGKSTV